MVSHAGDLVPPVEAVKLPGPVELAKLARAGRDFQLYVNTHKFFIVRAYKKSLYTLTYDCIMSKIF